MTVVSSMPIYERSDTRYEGRLTIQGYRKSFYGQTKTEVKTKAKEYLLKVENGYKEPKKIRLSDYIEYWLKNYKWNKIEPSSYTKLYNVYYYQIKDTIGSKMIGDLSAKDIQALIDERANPTSSKTTPLSMSGLKKILHLLRACLKMAVEEGLLVKNPCDTVWLPKESCIQVATKKQFSLSDTEMEQLRKAALSRYQTTNEYCSRDAFIILLILNLGLRAGEALALEWTDIDFTNKVITINKTVQSGIKNFNHEHGDNSTYSRIKRATKTSAGMRSLPLNDDVIWYLNELRAYDKRNKITSKYVSCTSVGTMNCPRNLQRSLNRITKKAQIQHVSLHTLRHTFGSKLLRSGVNIEVVSKLMGHANISITYNKYIHTIQEEEVKAMNINVC